jgi:hypothetical protein
MHGAGFVRACTRKPVYEHPAGPVVRDMSVPQGRQRVQSPYDNEPCAPHVHIGSAVAVLPGAAGFSGVLPSYEIHTDADDPDGDRH